MVKKPEGVARKKTYSVVYTWPDGRKEVRYTRPIHESELIEEVDRMRKRLGADCPYHIDYHAETS